jgi:hypothetical protein
MKNNMALNMEEPGAERRREIINTYNVAAADIASNIEYGCS